MSELIIRLPTEDTERLLLKHWNHLRFSSFFFPSALYVATQSLLCAANAAIRECPHPSKLMTYWTRSFGIFAKNRPGLYQEKQVLALVPYLDLISEGDIYVLWKECNNRGWFATRRKHLDNWLSSSYMQYLWNHNRVIQELDNMVEGKQLYWINHWIDQNLKADVHWSEILSTLLAWLDDRQSLQALEVVTSAVAFRGTREDISILRTYDDLNENGAKELIHDAEFAVRRRTIS